MSTTQVAGIASVFALVAYIPGALGSAIDELSLSLSSARRGKAHLTLLPPRPLILSPQTAAGLLSNVLISLAPFEVELTEIARFPVTEVLYIDLGRGAEEAHRAHETLNQGLFFYEEPFEYRPHVTLTPAGEQADALRLEQRAIEQWAQVTTSKRFVVQRLDLLRQDRTGGWQSLERIQLSGSAT